DLALERADIARVHDIGAEASQAAPQPRERAEILPGALAERDETDVVAPNAGGEIGILGHADHRMPKSRGIEAVDQIHEPVLEPADGETVDHVRDQERPRADVGHRPSPAAAGSSAAKWSARKSASRCRSRSGSALSCIVDTRITETPTERPVAR